MVTSGHINGQAICFQKGLDPHSFYLTVCCAKWCVTAPDIIVQDNFLQFTMQNVWLQPWMFLVSKCFFCLQNTHKEQTLIMSVHNIHVCYLGIHKKVSFVLQSSQYEIRVCYKDNSFFTHRHLEWYLLLAIKKVHCVFWGLCKKLFFYI